MFKVLAVGALFAYTDAVKINSGGPSLGNGPDLSDLKKFFEDVPADVTPADVKNFFDGMAGNISEEDKAMFEMVRSMVTAENVHDFVAGLGDQHEEDVHCGCWANGADNEAVC